MTSLSQMSLVSRRRFVQQKTGTSLDHLVEISFPVETVVGRNCENVIGCTQVPLGIAGPMRLQATSRKLPEYYLPLATTEGALVASVNRGCKATFGQGIQVAVENIGVTRAPVFRVAGVSEGLKAVKFVRAHWRKLQQLVAREERHLALTDFSWQLTGKNLFLRFVFDSQEAMGMNMATMATQTLADFLSQKLPIQLVSLSGNFCSDKKAAWVNALLGRGKRVWAEAKIDTQTVLSVLKTTPQAIVEVVERKTWLGSAVAGSLNFNAHYANVVAALFLATGQDVAHVVEGSLGITTAEATKKGLYFSVFLPDLMVGTVGGGTHLPTQKEALAILGFKKIKSGDSIRLAEIIGGAVLAGELSLTAALSNNQLACAHQHLGRSKRD